MSAPCTKDSRRPVWMASPAVLPIPQPRGHPDCPRVYTPNTFYRKKLSQFPPSQTRESVPSSAPRLSPVVPLLPASRCCAHFSPAQVCSSHPRQVFLRMLYKGAPETRTRNTATPAHAGSRLPTPAFSSEAVCVAAFEDELTTSMRH